MSISQQSDISAKKNQTDDSLRGMFRQLTKEFGGFDVNAEIQKQFADVLASNEKWRKRIASKHRDWAAEWKEDENAEDGLNSPDVEVLYWQTPRFPRLAAAMHIGALFLQISRPLFEKFCNLTIAVEGRRNAKLHKKLIYSIVRDSDLGSLWRVSAAAECGHYGKVTVSNGFGSWRAALDKNKFPGQNIPRIAFKRQDRDWRETPERLEERLRKAKANQQLSPSG